MRTEARGISLNGASAITPQNSVCDAAHTSGGAAPGSLVSIPLARYIIFAMLAIGGVSGDLYSKWYVFDLLGCPGTQSVWSGKLLGLSVQFDLATTFNHGALWGIGQNQTWLFATLSFMAVCVISYFIWTRQAVASWWLTVATGLLLAGTLGNLYDRLALHGWKSPQGPVYAVRDFLDFVFCDGAFHWATFNFADVFLVTGAIMLVLQSFWAPNESPSAKSEGSPSA